MPAKIKATLRDGVNEWREDSFTAFGLYKFDHSLSLCAMYPNRHKEYNEEQDTVLDLHYGGSKEVKKKWAISYVVSSMI